MGQGFLREPTQTDLADLLTEFLDPLEDPAFYVPPIGSINTGASQALPGGPQAAERLEHDRVAGLKAEATAEVCFFLWSSSNGIGVKIECRVSASTKPFLLSCFYCQILTFFFFFFFLFFFLKSNIPFLLFVLLLSTIPNSLDRTSFANDMYNLDTYLSFHEAQVGGVLGAPILSPPTLPRAPSPASTPLTGVSPGP
jgi:hypothetical protein